MKVGTFGSKNMLGKSDIFSIGIINNLERSCLRKSECH